jgi:hypothetical protein
MHTPEQPQLSLIERIERALVLFAYFIELDGDVHLPMFKKFQAELEELRRAELPRIVRAGFSLLTAATAA